MLHQYPLSASGAPDEGHTLVREVVDTSRQAHPFLGSLNQSRLQTLRATGALVVLHWIRAQRRDLLCARETGYVHDGTEARVAVLRALSADVDLKVFHDEAIQILRVVRVAAAVAAHRETGDVERDGDAAAARVCLLTLLRVHEPDGARLGRRRAEDVQNGLARDVDSPKKVESDLAVSK